MRLINRKHKSKHKRKHKRNLSKKQKRSVMSAGAGSFRKRIVRIVRNVKNAFKTIKNRFINPVRVEIAPADRTAPVERYYPDDRDYSDERYYPDESDESDERDESDESDDPDERDESDERDDPDESDESDERDNPNNCAICLINNKNWLVATLECEHKFHSRCIREWMSLDEKNVCPLCRKPIKITLEKLPTDIKSLERSGKISQSMSYINSKFKEIHKTVNKNETKLRKIKKELEYTLSITNNLESRTILFEQIKKLESDIQKHISFRSRYPKYITPVVQRL
jgi:hypothetical protein